MNVLQGLTGQPQLCEEGQGLHGAQDGAVVSILDGCKILAGAADIYIKGQAAQACKAATDAAGAAGYMAADCHTARPATNCHVCSLTVYPLPATQCTNNHQAHTAPLRTCTSPVRPQPHLSGVPNRSPKA